MGAVINSGMMKVALKSAEDWYRMQDKISQMIIEHSCIAGAISLLPIPGIVECGCFANQITMYVRINKMAGVSFSKNVLKSIGKFLVSQLAGLGVCLAVSVVATSVMRFIPGVNLMAGFVQAPLVGVVNYTCGMVYYKMLGKFLAAGGGDGLSDDEIIRRMKDCSLSKDEILSVKNDAEKAMKGANYSSFRSRAEKCAEEAKLHQEDYR